MLIGLLKSTIRIETFSLWIRGFETRVLVASFLAYNKTYSNLQLMENSDTKLVTARQRIFKGYLGLKIALVHYKLKMNSLYVHICGY